MKSFDLDSAIRKIPDFPHKGILFYDITGILTNPEAFAWCIDRMCEIYADRNIDSIACIEARGFVFAAPFAYRMGIPLVLVRKAGKLPGRIMKKEYSLEYGRATIEIQASDILPGQKVLVLDDLIATGGTLKAAVELIEEAGASVADIFGVIGLPFLNYHDVLKGYSITVLQEYYNE
ncbi:adenine phosphoribosyltransferase [Parasphaerochaeta coccoides]|uniref:Adenine phosphoribosyltransferase n=1 Tax=Parasphaerochaeta coccoides (strain ATCC BAA-1237 / DSM 17374 / SPN1) TaxID=760011 RepID=F4GKU0_PARC1|nr:adenine phosphoribosyltransferase [Parasphaerochaeta coccoides]AEC01853.1 adenine phosphoribosyltransferase [Parasphaerochaeta coccoides DSM 17374]